MRIRLSQPPAGLGLGLSLAIIEYMEQVAADMKNYVKLNKTVENKESNN